MWVAETLDRNRLTVPDRDEPVPGLRTSTVLDLK